MRPGGKERQYGFQRDVYLPSYRFQRDVYLPSYRRIEGRLLIVARARELINSETGG